eukprot:3835125-Pyramimonas_sp.AAC.1
MCGIASAPEGAYAADGPPGVAASEAAGLCSWQPHRVRARLPHGGFETRNRCVHFAHASPPPPICRGGAGGVGGVPLVDPSSAVAAAVAGMPLGVHRGGHPLRSAAAHHPGQAAPRQAGRGGRHCRPPGRAQHRRGVMIVSR